MSNDPIAVLQPRRQVCLFVFFQRFLLPIASLPHRSDTLILGCQCSYPLRTVNAGLLALPQLHTWIVVLMFVSYSYLRRFGICRHKRFYLEIRLEFYRSEEKNQAQTDEEHQLKSQNQISNLLYSLLEYRMNGSKAIKFTRLSTGVRPVQVFKDV